MATLPKPVLRILAVVGCAVVFVVVASIIDPGESRAGESLGEETTRFESGPAPASPRPGTLGTLDGRATIVEISAGDLAPRYRVLDPQGEVLAPEGYIDEIYGIDGLDLREMVAEPLGVAEVEIDLDGP